MSERPSRPFDLPARLRAIHEADYPRFSDAEMQRRRAAMAGLLLEAGLDHLVFCGANRFGSAVQWLTGWPVTAEAVGVFTPGRPDAMFVQHVNHAPLARRLAAPAEVAWGGGSCIEAAVAVLEKRARKERARRRHRPDDLRAAREYWRRSSAPSPILIAAMCGCARSSLRKRSTGCGSAPP